jgi:hypothetical protein
MAFWVVDVVSGSAVVVVVSGSAVVVVVVSGSAVVDGEVVFSRDGCSKTAKPFPEKS